MTGFAVCHCGPDTEAGSGSATSSSGRRARGRMRERSFARLLAACEALAAARGLARLVAGVNTGPPRGVSPRCWGAGSAPTCRAWRWTGRTRLATTGPASTSSTIGDSRGVWSGWVVMPTAEDVAVVRRLYAAVAAGDLAAVAECFDEDAVWHLPGTNPLSGTHRGWSGDPGRPPGQAGAAQRRHVPRAAARSGGGRPSTSSPLCTPPLTVPAAGWTRRSASSCASGRERSSSCAATTPDEAALNAFWGPAPGAKARMTGCSSRRWTCREAER